jgi:hypothetical protein
VRDTEVMDRRFLFFVARILKDMVL